MQRKQSEVTKDEQPQKDYRLGEMVDRVRAFTATHGPIFMEFLGTAGAGKSTAIQELLKFMQGQGYRVEALRESYLGVPTHDEGLAAPRLNPLDPELNIFTMHDTEAQLLARIPRQDLDLVVVERGPFDAEVFAEFHARRGTLTEASRQAISDFLHRSELSARFLATVAICVSPDITAQRTQERLAQASFRSRRENLVDYLKALSIVEARHSESHFIRIDGNAPLGQVCSEVQEAVISRLAQLFADDVLVIPRTALPWYIPGSTSYQSVGQSEIRALLETIAKKARPQSRAVAERDSSLVQILTALVPVLEVGGQEYVLLNNRAGPSRIHGLVAWRARHVVAKGEVRHSIAESLKNVAVELGIKPKDITSGTICAAFGGPGLSARHLALFWAGNIAFRREIQGATIMPIATAMASLKESWSQIALSNLPTRFEQPQKDKRHRSKAGWPVTEDVAA